MIELPKNKHDFNLLMEEIDEELKKEGVEIHLRPTYAAMKISDRFNVLIHIVDKHYARENDYTELSLSSHIKIWFDNRYGERLKTDFSPGRVIVLIKGDPYKLILPRIIGGARFVCDKTNIKKLNETIVTPGNS